MNGSQSTSDGEDPASEIETTRTRLKEVDGRLARSATNQGDCIPPSAQAIYRVLNERNDRRRSSSHAFADHIGCLSGLTSAQQIVRTRRTDIPSCGTLATGKYEWAILRVRRLVALVVVVAIHSARCFNMRQLRGEHSSANHFSAVSPQYV